jgi:uncharacterized protein (TIGR02444 family)
MVSLDKTGEGFLVEQDNEATKMWRYGLGLWKLPGVKDTCLAWQLKFGFDVSFLIFLSWVGCVRRESIGRDQVQRANAEVSEWRETVIEPARTARKYAKAENSEAKPELTHVFELLRAVELRSELREQVMLLRWWRSQEKIAGEGQGLVQSVKDYLSIVSHSPDLVEEGELQRICGLIANIELPDDR